MYIHSDAVVDSNATRCRVNMAKLTAIWAGIGVVLGLVLYSLAYLFRESFAAAGEMSADLPSIAGRATGVLLVPAFAAGWGAFALASCMTDDAGLRRWGPVLLGMIVAVGTAITMEQQFVESMLDVLVGPTIWSGLIAAVTVGVREWIER